MKQLALPSGNVMYYMFPTIHVCVCMCVCMYVCIYVCMYVYCIKPLNRIFLRKVQLGIAKYVKIALSL